MPTFLQSLAGTDVEKKGSSSSDPVEKTHHDAKVESHAAQFDNESVADEVSHMQKHRKLLPRQVMMTAIAGAVGAGLFIGIGSGLSGAGPVGLIIAFLFWMSVIWAVGQCQLESVSLLPVDGAISELPARFVDPAIGGAAAWNMLILEGTLLTFETNSFNAMVTYWREFQPAIFITVLLVVWFALNIWITDIFGEGEFYMAFGKVGLAILLLFYTFFVVCGANPQLEPIGFRYWNNPGVWVGDNPIARLKAFIAGVVTATFVVCGPEYITITAGEAINPRRIIPRAYNTLVYRLIVFFGLGAVSVGLIVPYNSEGLLGSGSDATASPYVISMQNLGISGLPDFVTVLILTSIASAGNSYVFGGSRTLYQMALRGQAPKFFTILNRHGVPYIAVVFMIAFGCLSYLACGSGTAKVLVWITSFNGACQTTNWVLMSGTWLRLNNAIKKQGLDRQTFLPARSRFQPYCAWYVFVFAIILVVLQGYTVFLPGQWEVSSFIFAYGPLFVMAVVWLYYKLIRRSKFLRGEDVDLNTGLDALETYTQICEEERLAQPVTRMSRFTSYLW